MKTTTEKQSIVKQIVFDTTLYGFKPHREFYTAVNINQKRWALLIEGKKKPYIDELQSICAYFKTDLVKYLQPAQ